MQASSVGTPTRSDFGTIFVAIELSQRSWLVIYADPIDAPYEVATYLWRRSGDLKT